MRPFTTFFGSAHGLDPMMPCSLPNATIEPVVVSPPRNVAEEDGCPDSAADRALARPQNKFTNALQEGGSEAYQRGNAATVCGSCWSYARRDARCARTPPAARRAPTPSRPTLVAPPQASVPTVAARPNATPPRRRAPKHPLALTERADATTAEDRDARAISAELCTAARAPPTAPCSCQGAPRLAPHTGYNILAHRLGA